MLENIPPSPGEYQLMSFGGKKYKKGKRKGGKMSKKKEERGKKKRKGEVKVKNKCKIWKH
jgi:hypothetical protein